MTLPIRTTFENLSIYIDNLEIEEIKSVNNDVFSTKSKDVGIWHTVVIHHTATESKSIVGGLYLIFKSANTESNMALDVRVTGSAKGDAETESEIFCRYIKYIFVLVVEYLKEAPIKDEKGRDFTVPEFQLTPEYFRHGFPD